MANDQTKALSDDQLRAIEKRCRAAGDVDETRLFRPYYQTLAHLAFTEDIPQLLAEVRRLAVFEDLDQNHVKCEGCQRYTEPGDMVKGADCCIWCAMLDAKG